MPPWPQGLRVTSDFQTERHQRGKAIGVAKEQMCATVLIGGGFRGEGKLCQWRREHAVEDRITPLWRGSGAGSRGVHGRARLLSGGVSGGPLWRIRAADEFRAREPLVLEKRSLAGASLPVGAADWEADAGHARNRVSRSSGCPSAFAKRREMGRHRGVGRKPEASVGAGELRSGILRPVR